MSSTMRYETSFGIVLLPSVIMWCCGSLSLLKLVRNAHSQRGTKVLHLPIAVSEESIEPSNRRIAIRGCDIVAIIYDTDGRTAMNDEQSQQQTE